MSRFCLFEGTWRKYHGLNNAATYLNECKRVSAALIAQYPTITPNYLDLWSSFDLSKISGIILYKECARLIMTGFPRAGWKIEVSRYLCMRVLWDAICVRTASLYLPVHCIKVKELRLR